MSNVKRIIHKDPVDVLTAEWLALKHEEKMLQARRRQVEDELLMHTATVPEGTVHLNDRIKIQFKLMRKVDSDALDKIWDSLPDNIQDAFEWEAKPVLKELRKMEGDARIDGLVSEVEGRPTFVEKGD
ncbi:MAG: hypothetical protein JRN15_15075 [Nitrososphaerota archaeon]|nr:hypothetical protein [Nitrososphaerota archaeon]